MNPNYSESLVDIFAGARMYPMWGRIGWAEIRRRYRRTIFGPFWSSISLAIFTVSMGLVWANLWKIDPHEYLAFLSSGLLVWVLLTSFMTDGCVIFISSETLIKQLPVTYSMLVYALIWRNLIIFGHNLLIYIPTFLYSGAAPNWNMLLIVPGLALLCFNGMWIALLLGILCARYRDIQQVVSSLIQISMFVTPIFWSPSQLAGRVVYLVDANLLYHYVAIVREPMLGHAPSAWSWEYVLIVTVIGWSAALYLFSRFRSRIAYWL